MFYDFQCVGCGNKEIHMFAMVDYDKKVMENGRLKRKKCKECGAITLYRHIIEVPTVLGGSKGYVSMERWQRMNPDNTKRKADQLEDKINDRHRKRVLNKLNKDMKRQGREARHKDYGDGQSEEKLKSDD